MNFKMNPSKICSFFWFGEKIIRSSELYMNHNLAQVVLNRVQGTSEYSCTFNKPNGNPKNRKFYVAVWFVTNTLRVLRTDQCVQVLSSLHMSCCVCIQTLKNHKTSWIGSEPIPTICIRFTEYFPSSLHILVVTFLTNFYEPLSKKQRGVSWWESFKGCIERLNCSLSSVNSLEGNPNSFIAWLNQKRSFFLRPWFFL